MMNTQKFHPSGARRWYNISSLTGTTFSPYAAAYGNSVYVVGGGKSTGAGYIATASTPSGAWTANTSPGLTFEVIDILYGADSKWVAAGNSNSIAVATDPTGTWTKYTPFPSGEGIGAVYQGNGHWVAVSINSGSPEFYVATDPTSTWTTVTQTSMQYLGDVCYAGGYWVIAGEDIYGKPAILYATDPTSTWTYKQISTSSGFLDFISYGNSLWVAGSAESSDRFTASSLSGTWTSNVPFVATDGQWNGSYWVFSGATYAYRTTDPTTSTYSTLPITTLNNDHWATLGRVAYGNGYWLMTAVQGGTATEGAVFWAL